MNRLENGISDNSELINWNVALECMDDVHILIRHLCKIAPWL